MLISITIKENELLEFEPYNNEELLIIEYMKSKFGKEILIEIHFFEKKNNDYLIIASISDNLKGLKIHH